MRLCLWGVVCGGLALSLSSCANEFDVEGLDYVGPPVFDALDRPSVDDLAPGEFLFLLIEGQERGDIREEMWAGSQLDAISLRAPGAGEEIYARVVSHVEGSFPNEDFARLESIEGPPDAPGTLVCPLADQDVERRDASELFVDTGPSTKILIEFRKRDGDFVRIRPGDEIAVFELGTQCTSGLFTSNDPVNLSLQQEDSIRANSPRPLLPKDGELFLFQVPEPNSE